MDWGYMGKLMLSVLVFAPGLLIAAMVLLIGVFMVLEKVQMKLEKARYTADREEAARRALANPPAGRVVDGLNRSLESKSGEERERNVS